MGWADRAHKKIKTQKLAESIINSPKYQEARKKDMEQSTLKALVCFAFIGLLYLELNFRCKKNGLVKFLEFVKANVADIGNDEEFLKCSNEYFKKNYDLDAMKYLGMEFTEEGEDNEKY